jgi:hypothetical protein
MKTKTPAKKKPTASRTAKAVGSGPLVSLRGWTECKKKMPKNGQRVLAMYKGVYGPAIVTYWHDGVNHHFGNPPVSHPATHWKPFRG